MRPIVAGRLAEDRRGTVLVEIAATMAVLAVLTLGAVEIARFVILQQKLDRVAMTVGDLVSRGEALTPAQLDNIFIATEHLVRPFDMDLGVVIISFVQANAAGAPTVLWQRRGAGPLAAPSRIGEEGNAPEMPAGLTVAPNESVVVAEVVYDYQPFVARELIGPRELYHRAILRPRLSDQSLLQ